VTRVLVADGDGASRRAVVAALRFAGYSTNAVPEPRRAARAVRRLRPDVVIIDPASDDGVSELRAITNAPIIVIAPSGDAWGTVSALDAGADDYMAKPLNPEELLARIRLALRRAGPAVARRSPVSTRDFTVNVDDRRWFRADGSEVGLTPTEWRIVEVLIERAGHLVTHAELLERVWGPKARAKPHYLRVQMAAIRRKVEPDHARPRYFITAPGLGLRFEPGDGSTPAVAGPAYASPAV